MANGDFCVIALDGWAEWWDNAQLFRLQMYVSIFLFFLSAVLAYPITRSIFFLLQRFTPKKWIWTHEAKALMMWQTALVSRAGLLWIALRVSGLSLFLCQWPSWLFGICFLIWMDSAGNVLRGVIVRQGLHGYSDDEKPGRLTLLYEGTTLAKLLLLMLVVYTYYVASALDNDSSLRLVTTTGFFSAIALALFPLLRNMLGAHYMFLTNMLHLHTQVRIHGRSSGAVSDAPLGFLVLETEDRARTFVPAAALATTSTTVFEELEWPLHLNVRLPPQLRSRDVRVFVQALDAMAMALYPELAHRAPRRSVAATLGATPGSSSGGAAVSAGIPITPSEVRARQTPRGNGLLRFSAEGPNHGVHQNERSDLMCTVTVAPSERWLVHFRTSVRGKRAQDRLDARAMYIEEITELLERHGINFAHVDGSVN